MKTRRIRVRICRMLGVKSGAYLRRIVRNSIAARSNAAIQLNWQAEGFRNFN